MFGMETSAAARLPAAGVWLRRGAGLARAVTTLVQDMNHWLRRASSAIARVQARRDAMRTLYALDDRMLRDIGLRREQVESTVDAMFRRDPDAEATQPSREVDAAETTDTGAIDASNDRHYESAA